MKDRLQVVVYGSSLNMAGIAASLKAQAGLEVICVDPNSPALRQRLKGITPVAIAFDMSDSSTGLDVTLLRDRPGVLLIGVDPSSNELLVLSTHPQQALCIEDLINVICRKET